MIRVKKISGRDVVLDKEDYLSILYELKILRFKVCRKKYWDHSENHSIKVGDYNEKMVTANS